MNKSIAYVSAFFLIASMLWILVNPGSFDSILIKFTVAFISLISLFLSMTWNKRNSVKKALLVLLLMLGLGSLANFAFNWGIENYSSITIMAIVVLFIFSYLFIVFTKPKEKYITY